MEQNGETLMGLGIWGVWNASLHKITPHNSKLKIKIYFKNMFANKSKIKKVVKVGNRKLAQE